jgi:ABC-2 type transport system ATP-binding protein
MLEVRDLAKHYGPVTALDGATFTAEPGRLVGFLGPNGAGKTTTMRCVFGLVVPERGDVRWRGAPITAQTRLRFGYMPEQRGLYPRMRVADQLTYFAEQHGIGRKAARASAMSWLDQLGLGDRAAAKLEDLSHGNQQRVQLAAALVHDPELLVLDEPFSGLDPIGIATLSGVLRDHAAAGTGIVFSSHQLDLVEDLCEDVVIISRGRVVAQGEIEALRQASGRRHLDIEVRGADGGWLAPDLGQVTVLDHADGRVRLLVDESVDLDALLERARAAGEVVRFSYEPPRLSELFMEAVADGAAPAGTSPTAGATRTGGNGR